MNFRLASEIIRGVWLVGAEETPTLLSMATNILKGTMAFEKSELVPFASYYDDTQESSASVSNGPKVMVINLQGVMVKYDQPCGVYGMESIAKTIDEGRLDENIIGAMVVGDTPGGSVAGTQTLADSIWNFRQEKPIVGLVNGNVASAGYWSFSQCTEIYLTNTLDQLGSIGVMATLLKLLKAMEMQGIEEITLYSSLSPDKNSLIDRILSSDKAISEKAKIEFDETLLTPIAKQFHFEVLRGRPNIDKSTLTGKMYMAQDAIALGMAEGIKTFSECLDRIIELSSKQKGKGVKNQSLNNSNAMKKREKLAAAVGQFEIDAEGYASFKEDSLDALEQSLENAESARSTAQSALDVASARIIELETAASATNQTHIDAITAKDGEISALTTQIANLKGMPPVGAIKRTSQTEVTGIADTNDLEALDKELSGMSEIDRISHLQSLLSNGTNK